MGHGLTVKSEAQFCKWKRLQSNGQCMWEVHKLRVSTSNLTKYFSVSDHLHIASIYIHTSLTYPGRLFLCFNSIWLQYTLVQLYEWGFFLWHCLSTTRHTYCCPDVTESPPSLLSWGQEQMVCHTQESGLWEVVHSEGWLKFVQCAAFV